MDVAEARRLKQLERENTELKKVVAELTLDNRILREVNKRLTYYVTESRARQ